MAYTVKTTSNFFVTGYLYFLFFWLVFAVYCIGYQLNKLRVYFIRRKRITDQDAVVRPLPLSHLAKPFNYVIRIPFVTEMIPVKHVIGLFVFIGFNMIFAFLAPFKFTEGMPYTVPAIGQMDRRLAYIGMVNWGFVFFLAQRNTILTRMSGFTFEEMIPYHRWIARIGLCEFLPHFVWRMIHGYQKDYVVKDTLFRDTEQSTGTVAMLGFLLMFGTAFEYIRRNHFEVFYYCHIIGLATAMIGACWHETGCFAFFIPAIGLWLIDRIVRAYKSWVAKTTSVRISEAVRYSAIQEGIARIVFEYKGLKSFKPGQYVFMSFVRTNKKPWQYANWHPFTISEIFRAKTGQEDAIEERIVSPESTIHEKGEKNKEQENASAGSSVTDSDTASYVSSLRRRRGMQVNDSPLATVHIKGLGKNTQALLKEAANNEKVTVRVDGPYGPHLDYQDYEVVAAFGAGIGITPAMAFIKDCVERRADGIKTVATSQIYLVWAVRAPDEIVPFMDMVTYWQDRCESAILPIKLNVSVYVTRVQEGPDYFENLKQCSVQYGTRPDIATTMENIKLDSVGREVWVHVCGSDLFTRSVMNEATRWNFDAHHETFEF